MSATSAPIPPNIAELVAAPFVGIMLNWGLMGVLFVQVYVYYLNFHEKDRLLLRLLVYGLFFIDIIQTGLSTWDGFRWFVTGWGDIAELSRPVAASFDGPFIDGITALIVQSFFCWRIYVVSGYAWWSSLLFLLTVVQAVAGVVTGVRCAMIDDLTRVVDENFVPAVIWLSACSLTDTLIAISTTYLLLRRSEYRLPHVDFVIRKIVRLTVETNAITAGAAILSLLLMVIFPRNNYFMCPPYIFGKLYTNSLLVMFNNRKVNNPTWGTDTAQTSLPRLRSATSGERVDKMPSTHMTILVHKAALRQADDASFGGV